VFYAAFQASTGAAANFATNIVANRDMLVNTVGAIDRASTKLERVVLVTTALHMPRSVRAFEQAGIAVIPAATDYVGQRPFAPYQLVPGPGALHQSHQALREWLSGLYYTMRGN